MGLSYLVMVKNLNLTATGVLVTIDSESESESESVCVCVARHKVNCRAMDPGCCRHLHDPSQIR